MGLFCVVSFCDIIPYRILKHLFFERNEMPESESKYTFERTELRVLQNMCEGDNEKFLNHLADIVGNLTEKNQRLENENSWLKSELAERDD